MITAVLLKPIEAAGGAGGDNTKNVPSHNSPPESHKHRWVVVHPTPSSGIEHFSLHGQSFFSLYFSVVYEQLFFPRPTIQLGERGGRRCSQSGQNLSLVHNALPLNINSSWRWRAGRRLGFNISHFTLPATVQQSIRLVPLQLWLSRSTSNLVIHSDTITVYPILEWCCDLS